MTSNSPLKMVKNTSYFMLKLFFSEGIEILS